MNAHGTLIPSSFLPKLLCVYDRKLSKYNLNNMEEINIPIWQNIVALVLSDDTSLFPFFTLIDF